MRIFPILRSVCVFAFFWALMIVALLVTTAPAGAAEVKKPLEIVRFTSETTAPTRIRAGAAGRS